MRSQNTGVSLIRDDDKKMEPAKSVIEQILLHSSIKAASFIVTLYGDVVEPRGGVAWMGNLIEICAGVGISETLVRTAVSRLVSTGQLEGERIGRRSYYRLSPHATAEFHAAAHVIFGGKSASGWQFVHLAAGTSEEEIRALERAGYARLSGCLMVGPAGQGNIPPTSVVFCAEVTHGADALPAFAVRHWDLASLGAAYKSFLSCFEPLERQIEAEMPMPDLCLTARLLLVDRFRAVILRDPRLPQEALPAEWPGDEARRLFARLYLLLSPGADRHVGRRFVTAAGALPAESEATVGRLWLLPGIS